MKGKADSLMLWIKSDRPGHDPGRWVSVIMIFEAPPPDSYWLFHTWVRYCSRLVEVKGITCVIPQKDEMVLYHTVYSILYIYIVYNSSTRIKESAT